ncbi:MAG TPA: ABC transporter permease [Vicinamibacterales bacterium]|nr:ABC transporter permease [Vicinamibacterales bacterium]
MIERLLQDLRYAGRTFRRAPGFLLLTVMTIAVGVGANAAIFSIVNAVLLRPLPFARPDDLVLVTDVNTQTKQNNFDATPANFLDWRLRTRSLVGLAAFRQATLALSGDRPESLSGAIVNANFFDLLDVKAALGRGLAAGDEGRRAPRVAVIGDGLWRQRFGARADAIGQMVRLNDEPHTIVGVMPAGIDYPGRTSIWVAPHWRVPDDPLTPGIDPAPVRTRSYFSVLARIRHGTGLEAAQADMNTVAASLERDFPNENRNLGVLLTPLRADIVGDVRQTVLLLFAAVGVLLVIATANVSGLLLARATARHQEIAVRIALGATRGRIVAQLVTESLVLAVLGGIAGVLLAMWLIGPILAISPTDLGLAGAVTVDRTVLLFGLAASTAAGLLFGLAPAHQLASADVHGDLKQGARGGSGLGQRRIRAALVAGEIALSLVLLVGAGLTIRSFIRLQNEPPGFNPDHVVTVGVALTAARYPTPEKKAEFWRRSVGALRQVPGVTIAGAISRLPLLPGNSTRGLTIRGLPPDVVASAHYRTTSPDFFRAMEIPLLRGRFFEESDAEGRAPVAIVGAAAAQRFWPNRNPLGERFRIGSSEITVVGVVGDVHAAALDQPPQPTIYVPYGQDPWPSMVFTLRASDAGSNSLQASVRKAIWQVDKDQPIGAILTMDEQLSKSLTRRRFSATLLAAFGVMAVSLAAIGLYGVLAFIVAQRRREIGVRMALGAQPCDVIADVMGQGLRLAGYGVGVGIALALVVTRLLRSLLFGTSPTDVFTFAAVATLLVAIAAAASLVPALRASRVDPLIALRDE